MILHGNSFSAWALLARSVNYGVRMAETREKPYRLEELLGVFSERTTDARTPASPGYTDISDIP